MKILGLIILIVLFLFVLYIALLLYTKIRIVIRLDKPKDGKLKYEIKYELFNGKIVVNSKSTKKTKLKQAEKEDQDEKKESDSIDGQKVHKQLNTFVDLKNAYLKLKPQIRKNIVVEQIDANLTFGMDDAAKTGIATGVAWTLVSVALGIISKILTITEPRISIDPVYDEKCFQADLVCRIRLRLIDVIKIYIRLENKDGKLTKKSTKKEKAAINYGNTN